MLLFGVLSFIQITFLPGLILLSLLRLKDMTTIQKIIYIFAFSLFLNYSFVTILTLCGIYKQTIVYVLIAGELFFIYLLSRQNRLVSISLKTFKEYLRDFILSFKSSNKIQRNLLLINGVLVLFYFSLIISNAGTIFYFVDPAYLIHLNTWAMDFANNMLPQQTSHFPQLIPANWSIAYLLIGENNIQMFPKFIMPLFFFGNVLMFIDLAVSKRNNIYLIGLIIYGLFAPVIYSLVFIADGSADLPVSFFAFLTFYTYLKIDNNKFLLTDRIIFFLFASTAAATKLAGFYIFTIASIYSLYVLIHYWKSIKKLEIITIAFTVVVIISISHFWYFLKPATMTAGLHQPQWVGTDYGFIFIKALNLMYYNWGLPIFAFFIITIIAALFVKQSRYVTLIMVIPPIIIWMFKFSDDFRNLSFVVPFLSYVSAFGLIKIIEIARNKKLKLAIESSPKEEIIINRKHKIIAIVISTICISLFVLINSGYFYTKLFDIYKFISIYYFQSHRINLLIDITPFTSIDYYQRTIGVMLLLIPSIFLLILFNVKIKHLFITLMITVVVLNFSLIDKKSILRHQDKAFEIVDARNYGAFVNTIIISAELDKTIFTNFKSVSEENRENLNFIFKDDNELTGLLNKNNSNDQFFLNRELLSLENIKMIDEFLKGNKINVLFDDGKFVLLLFN